MARPSIIRKIGLHKKCQVDIPEADDSRLRTLHDLLDYLGAKTA